MLLPPGEPALPLPEFPPTIQVGKMEGAESVSLSPPRDVERVAGTDDGASVLATSRKDFRVRCTSKRATFESAVQENVSINGQAWQEASDNYFMDSDIKVLEDQFDEIIVDITTKRKQYPRKILECVIKIIKAKQEILHLPLYYYPSSPTET
ncbi:hypothetical protein E2I00_002881 [Balaenoptera physalus]|uniref:Uncharacterized protein n=1 Tax=Balaenoptera physalus TaxID=9770 RepID=A0A643C2S3_BALPH|nr:hypothetical protein E2I00_002881 [Balaenoptera physalus]